MECLGVCKGQTSTACTQGSSPLLPNSFGPGTIAHHFSVWWPRGKSYYNLFVCLLTPVTMLFAVCQLVVPPLPATFLLPVLTSQTFVTAEIKLQASRCLHHASRKMQLVYTQTMNIIPFSYFIYLEHVLLMPSFAGRDGC